MTEANQDNLIDSLLSELLGEQRAPDLRTRILSAHNQSDSVAKSDVAPLGEVAASATAAVANSVSPNESSVADATIMSDDGAADKALDSLLEELLTGEQPPNVVVKVLRRAGLVAKPSASTTGTEFDPADRILDSLLSQHWGEQPVCVKQRVLESLAGVQETSPLSQSPIASRNDAGDKIVDVLLGEIFTEQKPPNLTDRILAASETTEMSADAPVALPKINVKQAPRNTSPATSTRRKRASRWQAWTTVAALVFTIALAGFWTMGQHGPSPSLAKNQANDPRVDNTTPEVLPSDLEQPKEDELGGVPGSSDRLTPLPDAVVTSGPTPFQRTRDSDRPTSDAQVLAFVNSQLASYWQLNGLTPGKSVGHREWLHRAHQFLVGKNPSQADLSAFQSEGDRNRVVNDLVNRSEFRHHWARRLTNVLVGNARDKSRFRREQLESYLQKSLAENVGYDQIAYELISAVGSNDPSDSDFNPATNFALAHQSGKDGKQELVAAQVCRVFLGNRLGCAQCHDHSSWPQQRFWEMESFFAQMEVSRGRLQNRDYLPESPEEAGRFFDNPNLNLAIAFPTFFDGTLGESATGLISEYDRRTNVANLVVASDNLSLALVNRLWEQAFGAGFTEPVDDLGPHNPPTHPLLVNRLAQEFRARNYDLKPVLKWIALSAAFERPEPDASEFLVASGRGNGFSKFRKRGHVVEKIHRQFEAIAEYRDPSTLYGVKSALDSKEPQKKREAELYELLLRNRKRLVEDALQQSILDESPDKFLQRIAKSDLEFRHKVAHVFLAILERRPSEAELSAASEILRVSHKELDALYDVAWTTINSDEFATRH